MLTLAEILNQNLSSLQNDREIELLLNLVGFPQTETTLQNVMCFPVEIFHRPQNCAEYSITVLH